MTTRWTVHLYPSEFPRHTASRLQELGNGERVGSWREWLRSQGFVSGTPFLVNPNGEFDVALNEFFRSAAMATASPRTRVGYAGDLARFLTFLWVARGRCGWDLATEEDHIAYLSWRLRDPQGPMVAPATWDREVASVNAFYSWQVGRGEVGQSPIPQVRRRAHTYSRHVGLDTRPATYTHSSSQDRVQWVPPRLYRTWRDVGLRGYLSSGLPDPHFRGRWAARNATYSDLMVRTGLRLSEQSSLTLFELPSTEPGSGLTRFWLPPAVAKGGSARWVYVPSSILRAVEDYRRYDRSAAVEVGRQRGLYEHLRDPWVVESLEQPLARRQDGTSVPVIRLDTAERRKLLLRTTSGLEPASLWVSEQGTPLTTASWKSVFQAGNRRCQERGVDVHVHPHMLRHTFAVVTLEQLQRGHIASLAAKEPEQRLQYTRVFGDPLDWVRRQLGHRSVATTQLYLHALQELEMETRMRLVPDEWSGAQAGDTGPTAADINGT